MTKENTNCVCLCVCWYYMHVCACVPVCGDFLRWDFLLNLGLTVD